jgi:hypothetical protein
VGEQALAHTRKGFFYFPARHPLPATSRKSHPDVMQTPSWRSHAVIFLPLLCRKQFTGPARLRASDAPVFSPKKYPMKLQHYPFAAIMAALSLLAACQSDDDAGPSAVENPANFREIASFDLGEEGAAEISAYDPVSKRLFVVNNAGASKIDVVDLSTPASPAVGSAIDASSWGGGINSVAAREGLLAVAVEADSKQDNGLVLLLDASTLQEVARATVGALPDMVAFSPDGKYIVTANEGEPSGDYSIDPEGSISIIDTQNGYQVTTLGFQGFAGQQAALMAQGFRVFGPGASLAQDAEPEYVAISSDSQTAWVTMQENNAVAKVSLASKTIEALMPLGFKDHSRAGNGFDASDRDDQVAFATRPVMGMYLPDAMAYFSANGGQFLITANEGDSRDYDGFSEEERVKDVTLDPTAFPDAEALQADAALGRLKITSTMGDEDGDGDYDALYTYGARSFSIWDAASGTLLHDSGEALEQDLLANAPSRYDDGRSDDKGVEPEGVAVGTVNGRTLAFIGLERADAVLVYDISTPTAPVFLQVLETGDAPEGIWFISKEQSPSGRSLLVVSSEDDGVVKVFEPEVLLQ